MTTHPSHRDHPSLLQKLSLACLYFAAISPLIFHFGYYYPHSAPKAAWFQISIELGVLFFLILQTRSRAYRPKSTLLTWTVVIFLLTQLFSALTSQTPWTSFIGNFSRAWGVWHMLHYGALYFIATSIIKNTAGWRNLATFSVFLSALAGTASMYLLLTNQNFTNLAGNSAYVAIYLYFHVFIAFWAAAQYKHHALRWVLRSIGILNVLAILLISNRGILLAFALMVLTWLVWNIVKGTKERRNIALGVLGALLVLYGFLFFMRDSAYINNQYFLHRITHISFHDNTLQSRLFLWEVGMKGFFEKPLTGWGPENYPLLSEKYYNPEFYALGLGENWQDRSHNIFIDQLVSGGIINAAAYMLLFVIALIELSHKRTPHLSPYVRNGLRALIAGYMIQGFFFFDTLNGFMPLVLVLAFINALAMREEKTAEKSPQKSPLVPAFVSIFGVLIIGTLMYTMNIRPLAGNRAIARAYQYFIVHEDESFQNEYAKGNELLSNFPVALQETMRTFLEGTTKFMQMNKVRLNLVPLLEDLERLNQSAPDLRNDYNIARYYLNEAELTGDLEAAKKARVLTERLAKDHPSRQFFLIIHAQTLAVLKEFDAAITTLRHAASLAPEHGKISWQLAKVLTRAGRNMEAAVEVQKALDTGFLPNSLEEFVYIGDLLANYTTEYEKAVWVLESAASHYPSRVESHERLMYLYAQLGDTRKMLLAARMVIEIDPDKTELVKKFLQERQGVIQKPK